MICCSGQKHDPAQMVPRESVLTLEQRQRVRPLLCDLEADFKEFAGDDGSLDASELSAIWKKCAALKVGELSEEDVQLIDKTAAAGLAAMDLDLSGTVTYEEFVSYMLGGFEKRGPLKDLRQGLQKTIQKDPNRLKELVHRFQTWDKNGDGFITLDELATYLEELSEFPDNTSNQESHARRKDSTTRMSRVLKEQFQNIDVDGDGKLDLWEVLAHALGRRKTPVELLLYDISKGISKQFSAILLGKKFEAIYHASVLVFGSEYWYGGSVFRSQPPCTQIFGPPLQKSVIQMQPSSYKAGLMSIRIGYTLATAKEFERYANDVLSKKYTRESYDVLTHNCIHFADEASNFLSGMHLPDVVRHLPDHVLSTPTARVLRPFLNRWLGGFRNNGQANDGLQDSRLGEVTEPAINEICTEVLGQGQIVTFKGEHSEDIESIALVTQERGDEYCLRYFDHRTGDFRSADVKTQHVSVWSAQTFQSVVV